MLNCIRYANIHFKPLPMPRTTNSQAAKHYRAIGKAYDTIGDVFKDGNVKKLYDEAEAGQPVWQEVIIPLIPIMKRDLGANDCFTRIVI